MHVAEPVKNKIQKIWNDVTCLNANYFRNSKYRTDVGNTPKPTNGSGRQLGLSNYVTWTHIAPSVRDLSVSESRKVPEMSNFDRIRVIPGVLSPERNFLAHPNQRTVPDGTIELSNHVTWTYIAPSVRDLSVSESRKVPIFDRIRVIPGVLSPERNYLARPNQRTVPDATKGFPTMSPGLTSHLPSGTYPSPGQYCVLILFCTLLFCLLACYADYQFW